jgi:predicted RNA-binding protein with PUA-like domain
MAHWLLKSEPGSFSIADLEAKGVEHWDGVRAYMARNNLMAMKLGEQGFFYHSSTDPIGVAGVCEVVREAYPDHTQFDPSSKYFDPKATPDNPRWFMPDVRFVRRFPRFVTLAEIRETPGLQDMTLVQRGMRLSVQPVTDKEWQIICDLGERMTDGAQRLPLEEVPKEDPIGRAVPERAFGQTGQPWDLQSGEVGPAE